MNLYAISGLGADYQAFQKIKWPEHLKVIHLPWLQPQPKEELSHYALRMIADQNLNQAFILCGLSFGGIICQEIHKVHPAQKIIIISSVSLSNQIPWYFKLAGFFQLHRIGMATLLTKIPILTNWAFGARQGKIKNYLQQQIHQTTNHYLQWSLQAILHWKQEEKIPNLIHIHGSRDKLFPAKYLKADYLLPHGSHFMILTHAEKISEIIQGELKA